MGLELNLFESVEHLEPVCPKCKSKVKYGVTTKYNQRKKAHVCAKCGHILK